jgi:hypothetical protein
VREIFEEQIKQMSDEALMEIYINPSQYQEEYINIVTKELQFRNIELTEFAEAKVKNEKEYFIIEKEVPGDTTFLVIGYISALAGGLLAIIMGYYYSTAKQESNSDDKVYVYDKNTRELGTGMVIVGIIAIIYYLSTYLPG